MFSSDLRVLCVLSGSIIMPELPEVETMRRGILGVVGSRIKDVERTACSRRPISIAPRIDHFRKRVVGRRIRDVGRVGKRVIVHLDSEDAIVLEPRMTGLVLVADPPSREHLRFRCTLSGGSVGELLYWDRRGLGSVRLISPPEFEKAFGPEKLGPDALKMSAELFRERLGSSKRAVKVAMLDQRAVAGIGNLVRVRDFALIRNPSGPCLRQDHPSSVESDCRGNSRSSGVGNPLRRLDAWRWHVPQRTQQRGRLPEPSPRVRSRGRRLCAVRRRECRAADRASTTGNVLLCRLPAKTVE